MWTFLKMDNGNSPKMMAIRTDEIEVVEWDFSDDPPLKIFTKATDGAYEPEDGAMSNKEAAAVLQSLGIPVKAPDEEE